MKTHHMSHLMKILSVLICIAIVCSCGTKVPDNTDGTQTPGNVTQQGSDGEDGHEYVVHTSAPDVIPVSEKMTNIKDITQIGQYIYAVAEKGIYRSEAVEGGSTERIFEKKGLSFIEHDANNIFACTGDGSTVYVFDSDGRNIDTKIILGENTERRLLDFAVADEYFVVLCTEGSRKVCNIVEKENLKIKSVATSADGVVTYTGNKIFQFYNNELSRNTNIAPYDLKDDTVGDRYYINTTDIEDAVYNSNRQTIIVYVSETINNDKAIKEVSLHDGAVKKLTSYKQVSLSVDNLSRIAAADNLVTTCMSSEGKIRVFDYENQGEGLNLAIYWMPEIFYCLIPLYEEKYGITLNIIEYDKADKLKTKLMAGDGDIDLYYSLALDPVYSVKNDMYADLSKTAILADNISRCKGLIDACASYEGRIFAIPICTNYYDSKIMEVAKEIKNRDSYMARYIDLVNGKYNDTDGSALKDFCRCTVENTKSESDEPLFGHFKMLKSDYVFMSPNAKNKEAAAKFLNELMHIQLGDREQELSSYPLAQMISMYPEQTDYTGVYAQWKSYSNETMLTIGELYDDFAAGKDMDKSVRAVYGKLKMIIEE